MAKLLSRSFPVSWDEFHRHARALAWKLADGAGSGKPFSGIVAVTRGGLVPAAIVARELDIRVIDTIGVVTYRGQEAGQPQVVKPVGLPPEFGGDGQGLVIIDDLVDTGVTARKVREVLPRAHFATVYAKPLGKPLVDSFISEVSQDTWIVFPWDMDDG